MQAQYTDNQALYKLTVEILLLNSGRVENYITQMCAKAETNYITILFPTHSFYCKAFSYPHLESQQFYSYCNWFL